MASALFAIVSDIIFASQSSCLHILSRKGIKRPTVFGETHPPPHCRVPEIEKAATSDTVRNTFTKEVYCVISLMKDNLFAHFHLSLDYFYLNTICYTGQV